MQRLFLFSALILSGCATTQTVTILHTNDHHGRYQSFLLPGQKEGPKVGGLAVQRTWVSEQRQKAKEDERAILLLSGGDINTGTFESDLQKAEPDFKGMSAIGYDGMAVGNHEWDNPLDVIRRQEHWSGFPFLSSNTRFKKDQRLVFKDYELKCFRGGQNVNLLTLQDRENCPFLVGIFGLTTPETRTLVFPDVVAEVDFTDPVREASRVVQTLKGFGADLLVAVTHLGHDGPEKDSSGQTLYRDVLIAKSVPDLDVIVGGHTQVALEKPIQVGKTLVLQAEEWGKYVGELHLDFTKDGPNWKRAEAFEYQLVGMNLPGQNRIIPEDPELRDFFQPFDDKADELGNTVVGQLDRNLDGTRNLVRSRRMPIGTWISKNFRDTLNRGKSENMSVDFTMMNGGGIRNSLSQGPITKRDLHRVHPFGNTLITVDLNPEQVLELVLSAQQKVADAEAESKKPQPDLGGGFPHFYGIEWTLDSRGNVTKVFSATSLTAHLTKSSGWTIEVHEGKVLKSSKQRFRYGTINFLAKGGDGYPDFSKLPSYVDTGLTVDHVLIDGLQVRGIQFKP